MRYAVLLALLACSDGGDTGKVDTSDTDADTDADSDTDTDTDADPNAACSAIPAYETTSGAMFGTVTTTSGDPVCARVNMCRETCITKQTDPTGTYAYDLGSLPDGTQSLEIVPVGDFWADHAYSFVPITLADGDANFEQSVVVLELGAYTDIPATGATEIEFTDGVFITVAQDDLTVPFGIDVTKAAGVAVPEQYRMPIELDGTVLGVWYLRPFEGENETGLAFRIEGVGTEGQAVEVWEASYTHYSWQKVGDFTVTDGAISGTGLKVIATLAVVAPPA